MAEKKKQQNFLNDLLKFGCLKGFKYFVTHMRGKEEMVCSIINEPSVPILLSASNSPASSLVRYSSGGSTSKDMGPVMMSSKQQRRLSGYGFINIGLPPASPSDSELDTDDNYTLFLVACYARYNCPYVWVRTNHDRLVRSGGGVGGGGGGGNEEKDFPLLLKSTSQWPKSDAVKVWDIIAELVEICCSPAPPNPFALDFDYLDCLHSAEKALATAAISHVLQKVLASGRPHAYDRRVQSDLLKLNQRHFHCLYQLVSDGTINVPQVEAVANKQAESQGRTRHGNSSKRPTSGRLYSNIT